jgi:hypothetical protein
MRYATYERVSSPAARPAIFFLLSGQDVRDVALRKGFVMHRTRLTLALALALVVSAFSASGLADQQLASASEHENLGNHHAVAKHYLPLVPNDASIGETGPWHASLVVQNMNGSPVRVFVMPDGDFDPDEALAEFSLLTSFDSRTLTAAELGLDAETASSVVVMAIDQEVWNVRDNANALGAMEAFGMLQEPRVAVSVKMTSPEPMQNGIWTDESHEILDGYTAIPINDVGWGELAAECPAGNLNNCVDPQMVDNADGISHLPIAQSNNNWNTILYVTNVEAAVSDASDVTVELIPTADAENNATWTEHQSLNPGETWAIDVLDEVGAGWVGSVRISSEASTAAVAARHKAETDMLLINTSAPSLPDEGEFRLSAPLIFGDYRGWNTGISLSNQSDEPNHISIAFYGLDGELQGMRNQTLPANGQRFVYLPGHITNGDEGWLGSAVLISDSREPFHAAVDQVNYTEGAAMSYTLSSIGAEFIPGNDRLGLALLQKSETGDMTGIQLFNPDPEHSVRAEIRLLTPGATEPIEIELDPLTSYNLHAPDHPDITPGTAAGVVVVVTGGDGQLVGVSNLVNYDVQGDGALVFPLVNGFGQYR